STLDVVRRNRDRYRIFALAAGKNIDLLAQQIAEFEPEVVVLADEAGRRSLASRLNGRRAPEMLAGPAARVQAATAPEVGFVMSAIVGVAGLEATYEAVRAGKRVGLANKEVLVSAGELVMRAAAECGSELIPVDSEHNGAH